MDVLRKLSKIIRSGCGRKQTFCMSVLGSSIFVTKTMGSMYSVPVCEGVNMGRAKIVNYYVEILAKRVLT